MRLTVCTCALFSMLTGSLLFLSGCSSEAKQSAAKNSAETPIYRAPMSEETPDSAATMHRDTVLPEDASEAAPAEISLEHDAASGSKSDIAESIPETPPAEPSKPKPADARKKEAEAKRRQRDIQAGLLTAGSFDDVKNFKSYQEFLNKVLQHDAGERFPRWAVGKFITLNVLADGGAPIGNATVEIRAVPEDQQQAQPPLCTVITGSDGRAILLSGEDKLSGLDKVSVRIRATGAERHEKIVSLSEPIWNFTLTEAQAKLPQQLDLALVIDTTGSMGDELEYLKVEIDSIAATIEKMFPQVQQRYALVLYRDEGDQYVTRTSDFTDSLADFRSTLSSQAAGGGGDYPEAMHLAMEHASQLDWRKDNTARVMFLVGDAPPHQNYARRTLEAGLKLRQQGVRVYPLGASGVAVEAEFIMRAVAFASVGQYLFLTDHSGIGNAHATPHVPEFQVERLDRLMIRMIASELAGKRLAPTEVIAIERGEMQTDEGLPPEPIDQQTSQLILPRQSCIVPPSSPSTASFFSNIPAWLMFVGLILGVLCIDVWDKRHVRHGDR